MVPAIFLDSSISLCAVTCMRQKNMRTGLSVDPGRVPDMEGGRTPACYLRAAFAKLATGVQKRLCCCSCSSLALGKRTNMAKINFIKRYRKQEEEWRRQLHLGESSSSQSSNDGPPGGIK